MLKITSDAQRSNRFKRLIIFLKNKKQEFVIEIAPDKCLNLTPNHQQYKKDLSKYHIPNDQRVVGWAPNEHAIAKANL